VACAAVCSFTNLCWIYQTLITCSSFVLPHGLLPVVLQAWLQSLLAPGTPIPDGAVAYIQLGGQEMRATWQQDTTTWVVAEVSTSDNHITAAAPVSLSLLFVDHPVVRLPSQAGAARKSSSSSTTTTTSMHQITLLLKSSRPASAVSFTGSDASSAPPEQPGGSDDDAPLAVQCVARGCWGTCLPVAVAGVEEAAWEDEGSKGAVLAVQVSRGQQCVRAGLLLQEM
jgi:hypothetical protein